MPQTNESRPAKGGSRKDSTLFNTKPAPRTQAQICAKDFTDYLAALSDRRFFERLRDRRHYVRPAVATEVQRLSFSGLSRHLRAPLGFASSNKIHPALGVRGFLPPSKITILRWDEDTAGVYLGRPWRHGRGCWEGRMTTPSFDRASIAAHVALIHQLAAGIRHDPALLSRRGKGAERSSALASAMSPIQSGR